jgi:hypothetical protein
VESPRYPGRFIVTLLDSTVTDAFGKRHSLAPPDDWWLFRTANLDDLSLVVWLRALVPIEGRPIESVLLGLDEYSVLPWAVERRLDRTT